MGKALEIKVPKNFRQWSTGARALPGGFRVDGGIRWEAANEYFFRKTQEFVHVDSGDLKESGRTTTELVGVRVVCTVEYGNDEVVYTEYEINRGGEHDFMGRGWEASQPVFMATFGGAWNRLIDSWMR